MLLSDSLKKYRARIDQVLEQKIEVLDQVSDPLKNAMKHGLLLGGKRVRPILVYAVGSMLGVKDELLDAPAAAIECIHAYSLIHDDLPCMDDDDLRRGHPTVHTIYGEAHGMLAGDALQTLAFEILSGDVFPRELLSNQIKMVNLLAKSSGYDGMCGGQSLDILAENKKISLDELKKVHSHKTGALIKCAVLLGALSASGIDTEHYQILSRYADNIGLAFQVHDDVLDIISDTEVLGKPQGSDIANNKSTYPSLLGLNEAIAYEKELIENALNLLDKLPYDTEFLREFAKYIIDRKS